ncbi:MAG: hypothetical protein IKT78_03830, partial [Ruminiclostridium sp.]|nr:hypothetical protein [Ruminiclostridium sp.]
ELNKHYETTKIIPKQYRSIDALNYIYDYISTSDFSVKEAIDAYEKNTQMQLERQRIQEQQYANELAVRQNNLLAEQADLLYEQNEIAEKARRDANIASAAQIAEMHNRNKILKNNLKR